MMTTFPFSIEGAEPIEVRVAGTPARPLFVAADVCAVLEISNNRDALKAMDADEKGVAIADTPGGRQEMACVTESGLYHLIFKSRKPAAKKFRRWVTEEVLPTIRRTGKFALPGISPEDRLDALIAPKWLESLGLDLVRDASVCQLLLDRVEKAARSLRFNTASFRDADGFQSIPVPVLRLAEGFFRRDASAPVNHGFFETTPILANHA